MMFRVAAASHSLARLLATRLNDVMPAAYRLVAQQDGLEFRIQGSYDGTAAAAIGEDEAREFAVRLQSAAYFVLDFVQDGISEHLHLPWPSADSRTMAMPGTRCGDDSLHLWYEESEKDPVLRIPEIPLSEIMDGP